jgi:phosphoglycolate phosphatase
MKRFDAIAFDLDGTLVDSAGGVAYALNAALAEAGLAGFALDTVRSWIGDGPDALIARALATPALAAVNNYELAARLRRGFDAATLRAPMAGSAVFDGIEATVAELAQRRPLVVVTNKPTALARAVLQEAGLLRFFEAVHGADLPLQRKPSPLLLRQAAHALGVAPARMLMVGDGAIDIAAALAAGSRAAWAAWGYGQMPAGQAPADVWQLAAPRELLLQLAMPVAPTTNIDSRRSSCPPAENPRSPSSSSRSGAAIPAPPAT